MTWCLRIFFPIQNWSQPLWCYVPSSLGITQGATDLHRWDLNHFFFFPGAKRMRSFRRWRGLKVNCHRSRSGSSRVEILTIFPSKQDTVARFHRAALQLPWGLNTSVCLWCGAAPQPTETHTHVHMTHRLIICSLMAFIFLLQDI